MAEKIKPGIEADIEAKKGTASALYFKLLSEKQYALAKGVDTSSLSPEEMDSIRQNVFRGKIKDLVFNRYFEHTKREIENLKKDLELSEEAIKSKIKEAYLDVEANPLKSNKEYPRIEDGRYSDGNFNDFKKLLAAYEITVEPEELAAVKERGIVQFLEKDIYNLPKTISGGYLQQVAKVFEVDIEVFKSPKFRELFFAKFFRDLEVSKFAGRYGPSEAAHLAHVTRSDFFPNDLLRKPENQKRLDDLFLAKLISLAGPDGSIEAERKISEYDTTEPHVDIRSALDTGVVLGVSPAIAQDERVQRIIHTYINHSIKGVSKARFLSNETIEYFGISLEPHKKVAEDFIKESINGAEYNPDRVISLQKAGYLSQEFLSLPELMTRQKLYIESLLTGNADLYILINLQKTMPLLPESLWDENFTELKKKFLLHLIEDKQGGSRGIGEFVNIFDFSHCQEFFSGEEIRAALKTRVEEAAELLATKGFGYELGSYIEWVEGGRDYNSFKRDSAKYGDPLMEIFKIADLLGQGQFAREIFHEKASIVPPQLNERYSRVIRLVEHAEKMGTIFGLDPEKLREPYVDFLIDHLGLRFQTQSNWHEFRCDLESLEKYRSQYKLSPNQMQRIATRAFQLLVMQRGINSQGGDDGYIHSNFKEARKVERAFNIAKDTVTASAQELYKELVSRKWDRRAEEVMAAFPEIKFGDVNMDQYLLEKTRGLIDKGDVRGIIEMEEAVKFGVRSGAFTPELIVKVTSLFYKELYGSEPERARTLARIFSLKIDVQKIIESDEQAKAFFERLRANNPKIVQRFSGSVDELISVMPLIKNPELFGVVEKYPQLIAALEANPLYGMKLIAKFSSLDKLSKANVIYLLDAKEEIITGGVIDPNSRDFGIAVQERLATYRNNERIIEAMRRAEIDTDEWLNYEDEQYIELGESERNTSEQIESAVKRISDSIQLFLDSHKDPLKEWQKELTEYKVPAKDLEELKREVEKMRERLVTADEKEAAGIMKGIENVEAQIANPKMVTVWGRLTGDLGRISVLKKDVLASFESLKASESALDQLSKNTTSTREKRKEMQKLKREIKNVQTGLLEKVTKLQEQTSAIQAKIIELLKGPLGQERAEAVAQEISEKVAEPLDHTKSDIATIESALSDKISLGGTSLRVSVWDRNPDIDLYLGNYTDCCVRIDSEHLRAECAIADYMTDLGIQIITVTDEKKKIPVVAAWCWIGIDDNDNIAFVVDNIEANTAYSTTHKEILEKTLRGYIRSYAQAIGIQRVVQGPANNDLIAADNLDSKYYKLGGYNRPSGYYLEGEDTGPQGEDFEDQDFDQPFDENDEPDAG